MACCSFITLGSGCPLWQSSCAQCWSLENSFNSVCCAYTVRPVHTFSTETLSQYVTWDLVLKPEQAAPAQTLGNICGSSRAEGSSIQVENRPRRGVLCIRAEIPTIPLAVCFLTQQAMWMKRNKKKRSETSDKRKDIAEWGRSILLILSHITSRIIGAERQNIFGWPSDHVWSGSQTSYRVNRKRWVLNIGVLSYTLEAPLIM